MAASKKAAKEKVILQAEARTIFGKKVKQLRKQGIIPGNIFGNNFESKAVSLARQDFMDAYKVVRETGVLHMEVGSESIPTLIYDMQTHPVTGQILHVDFRKVNMRQKIEADVPVVFVGESAAVKTHNGVLLTQADVVTVEALPANLPQHIEIDLAKLAEINDAITIADLPKSDDYVFTEDPEKVIVSVTAHKEESLEPETESEAPEITTAVEGEAAEGGEGSTDGGNDNKEEKSE